MVSFRLQDVADTQYQRAGSLKPNRGSSGLPGAAHSARRTSDLINDKFSLPFRPYPFQVVLSRSPAKAVAVASFFVPVRETTSGNLQVSYNVRKR